MLLRPYGSPTARCGRDGDDRIRGRLWWWRIRFIKPVAGTNMIFKGEDLKPGDMILPVGRKINPADIGTASRE